jgi:hypothetical protein
MILLILFTIIYFTAVIFCVNSFYKKFKKTENEAETANHLKEKEVLLRLAKKQKIIFVAIISYLIISLIGVFLFAIFLN